MGRAHEKRHICKCLISHAKNSLRVYNQKNSGYTKIRRKIRQQEIPKTDSRFLHIELLSREAWTSKDTKFFTPSPGHDCCPQIPPPLGVVQLIHALRFPVLPPAVRAGCPGWYPFPAHGTPFVDHHYPSCSDCRGRTRTSGFQLRTLAS